MTSDHHQPSPEFNRSFATTRWSLVQDAHSFSDSSQNALETLCSSYWYPLYAFVRRKGVSPDDAQDVTQSFIAELLNRQSLKRAEPARGRFRAFLLGALNKFLAEWRRQSLAQKRGGGRMHFSIDWNSAEDRYLSEPAHQMTPERIFDRRWALTVLDTTLNELRKAYQSSDKSELFKAIEPYITSGGDQLPYSAIAESLNTSEGAIKVAVHRLRKKYREKLRAEIAQTVNSEADLEQEIAHLFDALSN